MDDILREFVAETVEALDQVDRDLVRFEREPSDRPTLDRIFRLVHTVKGTCGFLGLARLEKLAHAAEHLIGGFREGAPVSSSAVTLVLEAIDRIRRIVIAIDRTGAEPEGHDDVLIGALLRQAEEPPLPPPVEAPLDLTPDVTVGQLTYQVLERPLRPGEVSLDELERAFRETEEEDALPGPTPPAPDATVPPAEAPAAAAPAPPGEAQPAVETEAQPDAGRRQGVRVAIETIDHLMTMVSELVLTRNQLLELARREEGGLNASLQRLSQITGELQASIMATRLQPIAGLFVALPRLARDLSASTGKVFAIETHGGDIEIDRQVLERLRDPLMHMVRNAVDHALESPEERRAAGKPPTGRIRIAAVEDSGLVVVTIEDDGRGIDLARLKAKALARGLISSAEAASMAPAEAARLVFHPGLSTVDKVTTLSGRGVGMDVVKSHVEEVGGTVQVATVAGRGTTITLKIPLTLAITRALLIEAGGHRFALAQSAVVEVVRVSRGSAARLEHIKGLPMLRLRERLLPALDLRQRLGLPMNPPDYLVVAQVNGGRFALIVDGVLKSEEIVVKPLSGLLRRIPCYCGATILGDGSVVMILDAPGLAQSCGVAEVGQADTDIAATAANDDRMALLLLRGTEGQVAVPLALVQRLMHVEPAQVERRGRDLMLAIEGRLMPLVALDGGAHTAQPSVVLIVGEGETRFGLLAGEVIDVVEEATRLLPSGRPGVAGTVSLRGVTTDVLDVLALLPPSLRAGNGAAAAGPRLVLFVGLSDFLRGLVEPLLRGAGFAIATAPGLAAAERHLAAGAVAAVLVDLDGEQPFAVCAAARAAGALLVGLATRADRQLLDRARAEAFTDVVGKFDREGLLMAMGVTPAPLEAAA